MTKKSVHAQQKTRKRHNVLHLKVIIRPSTRIKKSLLTECFRRPRLKWNTLQARIILVDSIRSKMTKSCPVRKNIIEKERILKKMLLCIDVNILCIGV